MCEKDEQICKHTPGPWRVSEGNGYNSSLYVMAGEAAEICEVFDDSEEMALPDKANACMIAAAPELYEALKWCADALQEVGVAYAPAEAALAKAEGRS